MKKRLKIFPEKCIGCRSCEIACSFEKEGQFKPSHSRIRLLISEEDGMRFLTACFQCDEAPCVKSCPVEAITKEEETGLVRVSQDICTGCGECISTCPFGGLFFDDEEGKAKKCDLCEGEPACIDFCPTGAIQYGEETGPFGSKESAFNPIYGIFSDLMKKGAV